MDSSPALLTDDGVFAAAAQAEAWARQAHARRLRLLAEVVVRGLDITAYQQCVRADAAQVRRRLAQVRLFLPSRTATGHPVPAAHPRVAAVLEDLGDAHLTELARALGKRELPEGSTDILVTAARSVEPRAIRHLAHRIHDQTRQAAKNEPHQLDEAAVEQGDLLHLRDLPGGRVELWGELSRTTGARLKALLDPPAAPRALEARGRAERYGEALADLLHRRGDLPTEAGERPHVSVTLDYDTLRRGTGHAMLDGGVPLSAAQARHLACDAKIIPVVLGGASEVLDLGRATRTVSLAQRRALHARDRGCTFPGCPHPARWCDAHHIRHWAQGGPTDLDNLVLLCRRHHSLVHHSPWRIDLTGGTAVFIPPRHIDPAQRPRQNLLHRPPTPHAA